MRPTSPAVDPSLPARVLRSARPSGTRVAIGPVEIGGPAFVVAAGPCAVESGPQTEAVAEAVAASGAHLLRGGAFKPRTSPYAFQGLGEAGLAILGRCGGRHGLPVVAEVLETSQLASMIDHVDVLQVGARNMQNFALLRALGKVRRPVLLKRGFAATVDEWLLAAEYLLDGGNTQVILCERGIRTFETATRNTLDLASVALVKQRSHLPVLVDPSHATGLRELVIPMALAAAAAGADGLLVEVHARPDEALCDGRQALTPDLFGELMDRLPPLLESLGRTLHPRVAVSPAVRAVSP
ncbi:MAG TPA: 3-deoxy-7-phosphoheptulonate synthase [Myxococcaceae bacterium]|nr:3-deoxy-7-phosphoheptulonate synthase [Myxococcaceae bacterium]